MDYGTWTLARLREECRKRKARISGKKSQLVERLESYDRNDNFSRSENVAASFEMDVPDSTLYKDLHGDVQIPSVTKESLQTYLNLVNKVMDSKAKNMYTETYLLYVRFAKTDDVYIKARCAAEMCKRLTYEIDISLDKNGVILECQCDCGAGMGPSAHCKHVCAVIFGLMDFSANKCLNVRASCTSKLQTFHHTKQFTGSPLKASELRIAKNENRSNSSFNTAFDPRPEDMRKRPQYQAEFRNTCVNFASTSPSMPVTQLYPPANPYAVAHDHDYLKDTPEDHYLQSINVTTIDQENIDRIQTQTMGQNQNRSWYSERSIRLQSSNYGRICKATDRTDFPRLAKTLTQVSKIKAKTLEHGIKYEPVAVKEYESITGRNTKPCGIFVSKDKPFLAASPDRVIDDNLLLEVKCPFTAKDKEINENTVPYLNIIDNKLRLRSDHDYYYQIQGQLMCSDRKSCDFVVYTIADIKIIRVDRDETFISRMVEKLERFFHEHFRSAILQAFFYRKYDKYAF